MWLECCSRCSFCHLQPIVYIFLFVVFLFVSTFLDPATRRAMGEQAVSLAKLVNYTSAGIGTN